MQHQHLAMPDPNLAQCLMNRGSIVLGKRRLFGLLEILKLNLLDPLS